MRRVLQFLPGRWWRWRGRPNRPRNALQWSNAGWKGLCYQGPGLSTGSALLWSWVALPPRAAPRPSSSFRISFVVSCITIMRMWRGGGPAKWRGVGTRTVCSWCLGTNRRRKRPLPPCAPWLACPTGWSTPRTLPSIPLCICLVGPLPQAAALWPRSPLCSGTRVLTLWWPKFVVWPATLWPTGGESPVSSFVQSTLDAESAALAARATTRNGGRQHGEGAATGEGQQAPAPGGGAPAPPPKGPNPPTVATGGAAAGASAGGSAHLDAASTQPRPQTRAATGSAKASSGGAKASSGGVGAPPSSGRATSGPAAGASASAAPKSTARVAGNQSGPAPPRAGATSVAGPTVTFGPTVTPLVVPGHVPGEPPLPPGPAPSGPHPPLLPTGPGSPPPGPKGTPGKPAGGRVAPTPSQTTPAIRVAALAKELVSGLPVTVAAQAGAEVPWSAVKRQRPLVVVLGNSPGSGTDSPEHQRARSDPVPAPAVPTAADGQPQSLPLTAGSRGETVPEGGSGHAAASGPAFVNTERGDASPHGDPSTTPRSSGGVAGSNGAGVGQPEGTVGGATAVFDDRIMPCFIAHCLQTRDAQPIRAGEARRLLGIMHGVLATEPIEWFATEGDGKCLFSSAVAGTKPRGAAEPPQTSVDNLCDLVTEWLTNAWQESPPVVLTAEQVLARDFLYTRDAPAAASAAPRGLSFSERVGQLAGLRRGVFKVDECVLFAVMYAIECLLRVELRVLVPRGADLGSSPGGAPSLVEFDGRPAALRVHKSSQYLCSCVLWLPELMHFDGIRTGAPSTQAHDSDASYSGEDGDATGGEHVAPLVGKDDGTVAVDPPSADDASLGGPIPPRGSLDRAAKPSGEGLLRVGGLEDGGSGSQVVVGDLNVCLQCAEVYLLAHKVHTEGEPRYRQTTVRELVVELARATASASLLEQLELLGKRTTVSALFKDAKRSVHSVLLELMRTPVWPSPTSTGPARMLDAPGVAGGGGGAVHVGDAPRQHGGANDEPAAHGDGGPLSL